MRNLRVLTRVSSFLLTLLILGCESQNPVRVVPDEAGALSVVVSYDGQLGTVDESHPVLVHVFARWSDGRGQPMRSALADSDPDTLHLDSLPPGWYRVDAYFDVEGNGIEDPVPATTGHQVHVVADSTTQLAIQPRDSNLRAPLVGESPIAGTPREDGEAEEVALVWSGELVAPYTVYNLIHGYLEQIRREHGSSIPRLLEIRFRPPWMIGTSLVWFSENARQALREGTYPELDSLNAAMGLAWMRTDRIETFGWATLYFMGRLHPRRLQEAYEQLPGVILAEPNGIIGDGPNVYTCVSGHRYGFLFRDAWGDCPSGCIHEEFWYFRCEGDACSYAGHYDPQTDPTPEWWAEAREAIEHYIEAYSNP